MWILLTIAAGLAGLVAARDMHALISQLPNSNDDFHIFDWPVSAGGAKPQARAGLSLIANPT